MSQVIEATPSGSMFNRVPAHSITKANEGKGKAYRKKAPKRIRYTLEDVERPVVTAEAHLLDADDAGMLDELLNLKSIRCQHLLPHYKLYLRIFRESIETYCADPALGQNEIVFWRSTIGQWYGESLCELTWLMFDRDINIEGLRRAAERKMGIPRYTLEPDEKSLSEREQELCMLSKVVREIKSTYGHLPDPESDAFFEVSRKKKKNPA